MKNVLEIRYFDSSVNTTPKIFQSFLMSGRSKVSYSADIVRVRWWCDVLVWHNK